MAKILLAEDDNNLREIYEARLQAEGYTVVSSGDGEEALVLAKNQLPDLIISDVMMPKISGFEMLDIIRNTDGLKNTKVIMLTALGQSEDQDRANKLGADKYLVKSQVTLEDIVKVAKELLGSNENDATLAPLNQSLNSQNDSQSSSDNEVQTQTQQMPLASEPTQQEPVNTQVQQNSNPIPVQSPNPGSQNMNGATTTQNTNDHLIDDAINNLSQSSSDNEVQTQTQQMPLASEPTQQEVPNATPDSTQSADNISGALSEEKEMNNINTEIEDFSNKLVNEETNSDSLASEQQTNQNSNQYQPNIPPVQNSPIQIPVQDNSSDSDSSVPINPPKNIIPNNTNGFNTTVINPSTTDQTGSNSSNDNIDPTNITL